MATRSTLILCTSIALLPAALHAQVFFEPRFVMYTGPDGQFGRATAVGDFNGSGGDDLAVGVPGATFNGISRAGRVCVYSSLGTSTARGCTGQSIGESPEMDDRFGAALAAGDFNGDGFDDLAVGVPDEDFGSFVNAGAVQVFHGSASRSVLSSPSTVFYQGMAFPHGGGPRFLKDMVEPGDRFGFALTAGDFDGDGFDDLAIGVPGEDIVAFGHNVFDAGAVHVLYGDADGLGASDRVWTQNDLALQLPGDEIPYELAEFLDQFGYSLATGRFNGDANDDLAIGVPFEDRAATGGSYVDAGAVHVVYGSQYGLRTPADGCCAEPPQLWLQDFLQEYPRPQPEHHDRFGFAIAGGDLNGNGIDDLAIGVPGEDSNTGGVHVLRGQPGGITNEGVFWSTSSYVLQTGDEGGLALTFGDLNGDGVDDLVLGVPGDDVNGVSNAGGVRVTLGGVPPDWQTFVISEPAFVTQSYLWLTNGDFINLRADAPESGDRYGYVVAAGDFDGDGADDLAASIPFEDTTTSTTVYTNGGAVEVVWGFLWR